MWVDEEKNVTEDEGKSEGEEQKGAEEEQQDWAICNPTVGVAHF